MLSILGLRQALARLLPKTLKLAMGAGIGLFLAHIGAQSAEGLGIVTYNSATLVTLGGCPAEDKSPAGECLANVMRGPTTWVGIMAFFLIGFLMNLRVRGAIFIIVIFIAIISVSRLITSTPNPKSDIFHLKVAPWYFDHLLPRHRHR